MNSLPLITIRNVFIVDIMTIVKQQLGVVNMTGSSYDGFLNSGIIEDTVLARDWSLNDVLDMDKTVDSIVQELINSMDIETKYLIVKDSIVHDKEGEVSVGQIISMVLREELIDMVSFIVNQYLKEAKVSFNDNNSKSNMDKEKVEKPKRMEENKDKKLLDVPSQDEKIITLKERIRQDSKKLDEKDMKDMGLI
jgi:hypothetical protein